MRVILVFIWTMLAMVVLGHAEPSSYDMSLDMMHDVWSYRDKVTNDQAIMAIIGEAEHSDEAMRYLAHALRNRIRIRGDLKGVYGAGGNTAQIPPSLWQRASKAWFMTASETDVTQGADHWLSDYDLEHCRPERTAFRLAMRETAYVGHTHFYRDSR